MSALHPTRVSQLLTYIEWAFFVCLYQSLIFFSSDLFTFTVCLSVCLSVFHCDYCCAVFGCSWHLCFCFFGKPCVHAESVHLFYSWSTNLFTVMLAKEFKNLQLINNYFGVVCLCLWCIVTDSVFNLKFVVLLPHYYFRYSFNFSDNFVLVLVLVLFLF